MADMSSLAPWMNDPTQMSPMTNLGLQMLANSNMPGGFGSIFGRSALQAGQDYQNAQIRQQQIQQGLLAQQMGQQQLGFMNQFMNGGQQGVAQQVPQGQAYDPSQAQSAQGGSFVPGLSPMPAQQAPSFGFTPLPQAAQTQQQAPQGSGFFAAPTQQDINSIPIDGKDPRLLVGYQTFIEKKPLIEAMQNVHKMQLEQANEQYAGKLTSLEYLAKNDTPTRFIKADQQLMAAWPELATRAGLDPKADFTDDGVRHAATYAYNQIATPLGKAQLPQSNRLITKGNQQIDPVTGKVEHEEGLEDVDLGNGQHALLPQSQAIGKPKYSPFAAVDETSVEEQAKAIASYRQAPFSGNAARSPQAAAVMRAVYQVNPNYDATQFGAKNAALKSFMAGKDGQTLDSVNTAVAHLQQLRDLSAALQNGNMTAINAAKQTVSGWFGSSVPTNFDAVRNLAAGEVNKIATGGPGAEGDRDAARNSFLRSASPDQLTGAIDNVTGLMAGRLNSVRLRFKNATKMDDAAFDGMLLPETRAAMAAHGGRSPGATSSPGSAPVRVNSPAEAMKLAPGTVFMTPDGRLKVR